MRTENTELLCLDDLRHTFVAEKHGADEVMILVANRLNAKLNLLGIDIRWINVFEAETNPDGRIGFFSIGLTPTETPATSDQAPSQP